MKKNSLRWILCTCLFLPFVKESIEFQMNDKRCVEIKPKTPGGITYTCFGWRNGSMIHFHTSMTLKQEFEISCLYDEEHHPENNYSNTYLNFFKNVTLPHHLEQFTLEDCTIPDISLSNILNELNVTAYPKQIQLQSITNGGDGLKPYHFKNLTNIETLRIVSRDFITINESIFQSLPLLNELSLNNVFVPSEAFKYTQHLTELKLILNNWTVLNGETFQNTLNLKSLTINKNQFSNITYNTFTNLSQLTFLDLSDNEIQNIENGAFDSLKELESLYLNQNNLINLSENLFHQLSQLENLNLENNHLINLPEKLFINLGYLSTVLLNNNKLERLPEKLFQKCRFLEDLNLENNKFNSFNDTLFYPLKKLKKLKLAWNNLWFIGGMVFNRLKSLTHLDISHNNLTNLHQETFKELKKITTIELNHNKINFEQDTSPFEGCSELVTLNLSSNSITKIFDDWREKLKNLITLDLSFNNLTNLEAKKMIFLARNNKENEIKIYLNDNQIRAIDTENSAPFYINYHCRILGMQCAKITINLQNNPIRCDCNAAYLAQYLSNTSSEVHQFINLESKTIVCDWPDSLKTTPLQNVDTKKLVCPLDSPKVPCPKLCECGYRSIDNSTVVNCSRKGMKNFSLVQELPVYKNNYTTELLFDYNNVTSLVNISSSFMNNVTRLSMSFNQLESVPINHIPKNLKFLALDHNKLSNLNDSFINQLSSLEGIQLNDNPWRCDCDIQPLWNFIHSNKSPMTEIVNMNEIVCINTNRSLIKLVEDDFCPQPYWKRKLWLGLFVGFVFLISSIIILYFVYESEIKGYTAYYKWLLWDKKREFVDDKEFDAFVSYSCKDGTKIMKEMMDQLEEGCTPPYKLCLHFRDFTYGPRIDEQIKKAVKNSRRTIIVLTPEFVRSVWARREFQEADLQTIMDHRTRLIIVKRNDVNPDELEDDLKDYLNLHTYLEWGKFSFWKDLKFALSTPPPFIKPEYWIRNHKIYRRKKAVKSNPEAQSEEEVPLNEI